MFDRHFLKVYTLTVRYYTYIILTTTILHKMQVLLRLQYTGDIYLHEKTRTNYCNASKRRYGNRHDFWRRHLVSFCKQ